MKNVYISQKFLSSKEIAEIMGVSLRTAQRMVKDIRDRTGSNHIPSIHIDDLRDYLRLSKEAFLELVCDKYPQYCAACE